MGLFAKKVKDEDLCFIRDLMDVIVSVTKVFNTSVGSELMKQIVSENHMEQKLYDFTHNNYNVEDCYPSDQKEKFRRAQVLLKIAKDLNLSGLSHCEVISAASACIKKMGFSYNEKIELINTCIVELSGVPSVDEIFINSYIHEL